MEAKKFINAYLKGKIPNIKYRTALSDNSWLNIIRINRKYVCKSIHVFTLTKREIDKKRQMEKKSPKFWLEGLVAATFTPFDEHGELNLPKIEDYCKYLQRNGIHHIYVNGTTGEGASLTVDERKQIVEKWLSVAKGKLSVTVHVGSINIKESKELARHAQEVGADAIGALPSLFFKPQSLDALVDYCRLIAAEAPSLPFYYYHLPVFTGVELNMEDFLTQAKNKIPTLNGIKFSSKDLVDMIGCVHVDGGNFNILYGCDEQLMAGFVMGAQGAVGSLHNFIPHVYQRMIKNLDDGDIIKARGEQIKGQRTCRILYKYGALLGGNVAALKYYMPLVGLDVGPPRQPMRKIKEHELENLRAELEAIGFFNWH